MPEEPKKIIVDDDWKAEAQKEKERLAAKETQKQPMPEPSLAELVNIIVMQAMAALGLLTGPGGQRMPADPEVAKHFIDLLQLLEEKTRNNLTTEEKSLLDQVLYETRMAFVQVAGSGSPPPAAGPATPQPETPGG
ncbi:MAG: DUF1844 domain-containing protein [Phycisphaerae bacterium]|nr:DUF1844 domain-containing protein [Phycisphaerae bacterium]